MPDLEAVRNSLNQYITPSGAAQFFRSLGYPVLQTPLPYDDVLDEMPQQAKEAVGSLNQIFQSDGEPPFRIFHAELRHPSIRRTDIRYFLEAFYRRYPQGENLFVFSPKDHYDDLAFVSPLRLPDPRDPQKVRLWLRVLQVRRDQPYRTDLEVLERIRADDLRDPQAIWKRHKEAFSIQRVTEQFFQDYSRVFREVQNVLRTSHEENGPDWARDYAHQVLNRIMFLYFIARKGWLQGPDGSPDRNFMRHFWEAYRETGARDAFHRDWLEVLFFEAFNNRWQNRAEYLDRFPDWLVRSFSQAPYLNGGLYTRRPGLDDRLQQHIPDDMFVLLFERWVDGTFPGLFERYNFTVVESGRLDDEVAVDPEMLGVVYERLVNVTFEEEGEDHRGTAGIFYTPRTEIDLMCRLALVDWLANQLGGMQKDLLYQWVFAFSEEERKKAECEITNEGLWEQLDSRLKQVRVCDPACGSGSFLVGMMLVLDELQARCSQALGQSETPYERRKRILQDQLYGVDVMEWAVRVAELRLWLQLVVETKLEWWETKARPLLPNLNLKLRPGDSLLQTLGDLDLSHFRRGELSIPPRLKGRLTQLKGKKRRFFQGEETGLTEEMLRKEERDLFRDILDHRIHDLQKRLADKRNQLQGLYVQASFSGMPAPPPDENLRRRLEEEVGELEKQLEYFQRARDALTPDAPPPFVWDMAFVEVFEAEEPGFDIVIGNPPYVRQEKIQDYLGRFDRKEYLHRLNEGLRAIYPGFMSQERMISGRADYYVYFYLHALSLLARRGTFCFITSNSWLDVDFGKDLQDFFLRFGHLKMVIDNRAKRSFAQADVNTVIVLAGPPERERPLSEEKMKAHPVRFVAFRVPFEEAISPVVFSELEDTGLYEPLAGFRVLRRPEFRAILHDQWSLYQEGLAEPEDEAERDRGTSPRRRTRPMDALASRTYTGSKWGGKYLRAPDIFFTILEKGKDKLVRLGDIAEVRFGIKTGANEFFYLEPVEMTVKEVAELRERDPMTPVRVRNSADWEGEIEAAWLRPVIKSPQEIKTLQVRLEDLRYLIFTPPEDVRKAIVKGQQPPLSRYPKAAAYIRWGDVKGYPENRTCASRSPWWMLPIVSGNTLWAKELRDRLGVFVANDHFLVDCRLYVSKLDLLEQSYLNSTANLLNDEANARQYGGGGGPRSVMVYEVNNLLNLTISVLNPSQRDCLLKAFERLASREVRSIFEELGFALCRERRCSHPEHPYEHVRPEALTLEQVQRASPDRFELDRVVFDVLGLTDGERLEVYRAVAQLVKDRLVKAMSV